jgi:hypothetical protein
LVTHFTLQCMPFCMKVAQRPLMQSASTVHVAPKIAPMAEPVLLVALPVVLLDALLDVLLDAVVDPAPPLPP